MIKPGRKPLAKRKPYIIVEFDWLIETKTRGVSPFGHHGLSSKLDSPLSGQVLTGRDFDLVKSVFSRCLVVFRFQYRDDSLQLAPLISWVAPANVSESGLGISGDSSFRRMKRVEARARLSISLCVHCELCG
jgi:hypothetical protein